MCDQPWDKNIVFNNYSNFNNTNFTITNLTDHSNQSCQNMESLDNILAPYLLSIMCVTLLVLIIISFFGKDNDDSKFFVLNTAVINFILGVIWQCSLMKEDLQNDLTTVVSIGTNIAVASIFPLALTRFMVLYLPFYYERFFTKKTLVFWILGYDLFMLGYFLLESYVSIHYMTISICLIIFIFNLIFAIMVFMKIHAMMKMVEHDSNLDSYINLRRASIVCIFQTSSVSLNLITIFYSHLFLTVLLPTMEDMDTLKTLMDVYLVISVLKDPMYQVLVFLDTLVTLFVLRSYRNTMKRVWMYVAGVIWRKKHGNRVTITVKQCSNVS